MIKMSAALGLRLEWWKEGEGGRDETTYFPDSLVLSALFTGEVDCSVNYCSQ